jgi:hypothetical protein
LIKATTVDHPNFTLNPFLRFFGKSQSFIEPNKIKRATNPGNPGDKVAPP